MRLKKIMPWFVPLCLLAGVAHAELRPVPPVIPPPVVQDVQPPVVQAGPSALVKNYALIVHANYEHALQTALALQKAVNALVTNPSDLTLNEARSAWIAAHAAYTPTQAYRFYGGPVDIASPYGRSYANYLNAWPVDETTIDDPTVGQARIQNAFIPIGVDDLRRAHKQAVSSDVTLGYHVIEYLLWGKVENTAGPGGKGYWEFATGKRKDERVLNERRRTYLVNVTEALVQDLQAVVNAWSPDQNNYATQLLSMPEHEAIGKIVTGLGTFASTFMANGILKRSLTSGNSRDESSRFSDTTKQELLHGLSGIQAVYAGVYGDIQGESLSVRVEAIAPTLETLIYKQLEKCAASLSTLPDAYSQLRALPRNSEARKHAEAAASDLLRLGELMRQLGSALGANVEIKSSSEAF
jgi:putative iron-regulated protein